MCEMASFVVTRTNILWLENSDSHEEIIEHYKLNDKTSEPDFVRVEISPPDKDYRLPPEKWVYKTDQDFLPEWYNEKEAEVAVRDELKNWYAAKVVTGGKHKLSGIVNKIILAGEVDIVDMSGGGVVFCDSSTGKLTGQSGGVVWFYDSSTGKLTGQSGGDVRFCDSSKRL